MATQNNGAAGNPNPVLSELVRESFEKKETLSAGAELSVREPTESEARGSLRDAIEGNAPTVGDGGAVQPSATPDGQEQPPADGSPPGEVAVKRGSRVTVAELAEVLGTDQQTLYEVLEIPQRDERPAMLLGELKDLSTTAERHQERESAFEARRIQQENSILARERALADFLAANPDAFSNESRQQYGQIEQERIAGEVKKAREMFPEWADPERERADVAELIEAVLKPRGLDAADFEIAASHRHNWIKLFHDLMVAERQLASAQKQLERVTQPVPKTVTQQRSVRGAQPRDGDSGHQTSREKFARLLAR